MSEITAAMVKELREITSAGMLDCKKALVEAQGDMENAIDWLRKKGLASAAYTEASAYATAAQGAKADAAAPADSVYTKTEVDAFWAWEEL